MGRSAADEYPTPSFSAARAGPAPAAPRPARLAIALALAALALAPRCLGLAFFTIDEPYHWIMRVRLFAEALRAHDWAATDVTGHPGVTTMWLGTLGRWLVGDFTIGYTVKTS